ncbi:hypothetical protein ACP26L_25700 [Paenibacillus sp. S-38]|uniref:hypothetical protein n=1 Tax=Paenibacillus sp. S-38 TaxID=3416710 RepID=UPI003CF40E7E
MKLVQYKIILKSGQSIIFENENSIDKMLSNISLKEGAALHVGSRMVIMCSEIAAIIQTSE